MNKAILVGNLTKDPELTTTQSGINVARFTVACQRKYTNENGERDCDFINCVAWRKQAENISKYCTKGTQVAVEGRIQTRSYDAQDGTKRYVTEIIADNVTFLGRSGATSAGENNYVGAGNDIATTDISEDPFKDFGSEVALSDDDLPF